MELGKKAKRLLLIGLIGAALTMIGDCLLMGVSTYGAQSMIDSYLIAAPKISYTRIGLAAFFGYIGIPVSAMGYYALCMMCKEQNSRLSRAYRASLIAFGVLGGGIHVMCCFIMTGLKKNIETGTIGINAVMATLKEQAGYLLPCMAVFLAVYLVFVVSLILLIGKKKTTLPAWVALVNPLTMKILLNLTRVLGYSAVVNGIGCSNMSLGCGVILLLWLALTGKKATGDGRR